MSVSGPSFDGTEDTTQNGLDGTGDETEAGIAPRLNPVVLIFALSEILRRFG